MSVGKDAYIKLHLPLSAIPADGRTWWRAVHGCRSTSITQRRLATDSILSCSGNGPLLVAMARFRTKSISLYPASKSSCPLKPTASPLELWPSHASLASKSSAIRNSNTTCITISIPNLVTASPAAVYGTTSQCTKTPKEKGRLQERYSKARHVRKAMLYWRLLIRVTGPLGASRKLGDCNYASKRR